MKNQSLPKEPKPFVREGDEYGNLCHWMSGDGPLVIDLNMDTFKPAEARRLARWLDQAADYVQAYNRARKKP